MSSLNRDLAFLSHYFEMPELPREKRYLLKYFTTDIQHQFLKYFFVFWEYENFTDHTGEYCAPKTLKVLVKKLLKLEYFHRKAKDEIDLELLAEIESGKFKLRTIRD